uniref:Bacterio-opsin activator n=1 Tax=Archaeoglobus fulgidus TaxID=2234 RepID=A0A7C3M8W3_ARCFL
MLEVQIKTKLPENCTLTTLNEIIKNCVVRIEGFARKDDVVRGLLKVKGRDSDEILRNLPSHCEGVKLSSKEAKVLIKEHTCMLVIPILESGCVITGVDIENHELVWNIICDDDGFLTLLQNLEGVDFELIYKGRPAEKDSITYREEEILKIALEKGYFDFPRRIRLEELAKFFGIAPSTLSEILRRGQKKVLEKYFDGKV